ncbi:MAG: family 43 glycosylhydrolase [Prevotella sp.]|jgi:hypothetical protein|nr:family 43 glycosylhydrolase [Prevotella sp.]
MKKTFFYFLFLFSQLSLYPQVKDYNPSIQPTTHFQYFKPAEEHLFPGDCMPYYHNGTFYLYWLLDEGHHSGLNGLGGHQWALSTSKDLKNWKHYAVALGIDEDWEKSICTGSVIAEGDKFYAFYSTRFIEDGHSTEQLSYAISTDDGITYEKQKPNPFYEPPADCDRNQFRDPRVFKDKEGAFHLFVSGYKKDPVLSGQGGYLAHLISKDLMNWTEAVSPLTGQPATPECSDYFEWNGWYYLIYSVHSDTYYLKSRQPYGPWEWPKSQALLEKWANVYKTAPFEGGRRIATAFIGGKWNNKDSDGSVFGGNILLRELFQEKDGSLRTAFLPEVLPDMGSMATPDISTEGSRNVKVSKGEIQIDSRNGIDIASIANLPDNYRISLTIEPKGNYDEIGLYLKATDKNTKGYKLELNTNKRLVLIHNTLIEAVEGLDKPVELDVIVKGDIIDINVNNQRSIVNRLSEQKGNKIFFFVKNGSALFKDVKVFKIE